MTAVNKWADLSGLEARLPSAVGPRLGSASQGAAEVVFTILEGQRRHRLLDAQGQEVRCFQDALPKAARKVRGATAAKKSSARADCPGDLDRPGEKTTARKKPKTIRKVVSIG